MTKLTNGLYRTEAGSFVTISGKHGGIATAELDWLEEPNACDSCRVDPYPQEDLGRWLLCWECEVCGGGFAEIHPVGSTK